MPLLVVVAISVGRQLDHWLGTAPWMLLTLLLSTLVLGLGAVTVSVLSAGQAAHRRYVSSQREARGITESPRDD